ncbi:MAG: tryptophan halogenase family protein [Pseudomonadota bacterium]
MSAINSIVIVGGGSAGWMSACYLQQIMQGVSPEVNVTLVESPSIPTVGVGEATIPGIRQFLATIGAPEIEMLYKTNATIKAGIRFENWLHTKGESYYHPFEYPVFSDGVEVCSHWVGQAMRDRSQLSDFAHDTGVVANLCDANKVPKGFDDPEYEGPSAYAYHLDAALLGEFLRDLAVSRGVRHVVDTVDDITQDEHGNIVSLQTAEHGEIKLDFCVDCTGFAAVLIEKRLGVGYDSYADQLLCDSAVALPTPYVDGDELRSYTLSAARPAGWQWGIDLANRRGNGYVYASAFADAQDAEKTLRETALAPDAEALHLKMRVGVRKELWHKNCLAVGLSGGFVEPLESTGLQLIDLGLRLFFEHFPSGGGNDRFLQSRYNQLMRGIYDDVRDFVMLHYVLTQREDTPFWRTYRHEVALPDSLRERLELWRSKPPTTLDFQQHSVFNQYNYMYVLAGMDALVPNSNQYLVRMNPGRLKNLMGEVQQTTEFALDASVTQKDFITRMRAPFGA